MEDRKQSDKISKFWDQQQYNCIKDSLRMVTDQQALIPLHTIAHYYGPEIAWYFAFIIQLIGWLLIPSIIGIALGIYMLVSKDFK